MTDPTNVRHLHWLPQVPDSLIDIDQRFSEAQEFDGHSVDRWLHYGSHSVQSPQHAYSRVTVSPALADWIRLNICETWKSLGFSRSLPPANGAHHDSNSEYTLQYLLTTGGKQSTLIYYEPIESDLASDPIEHRTYFGDYTKLRAVEHHKLPLKQWFLLYGKAIHSCEHIESARDALQIRFMSDPLASGLLKVSQFAD
jgi:hypothetical protein